jgi:3-deoxy-D-manno-octulosonic-acid transferase
LTSRLIDYLYWFVQALGFPFIVLYLLRRSLRDRRYIAGLGQRFGRLPVTLEQTAPGCIWLHAVSVGEVLTATPLVARLKEELPGTAVFVSVSTLAGFETARAKFGETVFFAPLDYRFAVRAVLRRLKPAVVVVMETEIWPNLYGEAKRFGCGLVVVNGRISDKAIGKYERLAWFFRTALSRPDMILAQDETAAARYRRLGAARVVAAGNLKYDFDPMSVRVAPELEQWLKSTGAERVWIAASTMPPARTGDVDEDDVVIQAFGGLAERHPKLLLILVPRKPERFGEAGAKLESAGIRYVRRSQLAGPLELPGVLLLDSIGELSGLFGFADVVFMGGSLAERGGHNILEPAAFGKPVIVGPHMENFTEITAAFEAADALVRIPASDALEACVDRLLLDGVERLAVGEAAAQQSTPRRGATARAVERIRVSREDAIFAEPAGVFMRMLGDAWADGADRRKWKDLARSKGLSAHVVSVGNLAMGGSGKTPFVLWLARRLEGSAILTRGYRRQSREIAIVLRGEAAPVSVTGDEAQIFVRANVAAVGIGANRYEVGRRMEAQLRPEIFLLDDGFQHWRLRRNCDVVLIDALNPFSRGVFPAGRLRERESALSRADVFVITRAEAGRTYDGIVRRLRKWNSTAPIYLARTIATQWRTIRGEAAEVPAGRAGAFCGLANPVAFWKSVAACGIDPAWRREFADHHKYTMSEVAEMSAGVDVLLTTQKDVMNLPEGITAPILWLDIDLQVDDEAALLRHVSGR